jgi:NADH-quinone oxidoreductase subunit F
MQRLTDACCEKCTHTPAEPCVKYVECRVAGPLCHDNPECRRQRGELRALLQREKLEVPVVTVGTGTCGRGAGAMKILAAANAWSATSGIPVRVEETGCIGMCTAEPLLGST